eukprot:COSAG02_NODE_1623_length_11604_cov_27.111951_5_plen_87_part_00
MAARVAACTALAGSHPSPSTPIRLHQQLAAVWSLSWETMSFLMFIFCCVYTILYTKGFMAFFKGINPRSVTIFRGRDIRIVQSALH